ncbi:1-deoxy-D-xylulose-5-phosphate synthase N-terminal domain-containing protein [Pseudohoeflea coraliihabitans]|uniref:Transketolase n=1 Tax=Pseudohoeflea coraliihabitans TaxID=2860393 RepID=A0ABS6WJ73_9HYPH|nr:1-deoxy-D-xylulose-5-phosphate synthase N-terminal domain-containing protein [Pseudohoeflea sp. DP4N28-3]MBW3095994.1 transketolase [Pseudohoeflea sp. DP4N28-3]
MTKNWVAAVEQAANNIRKRVLGLTIKQNGCYLSQALSSAEILSTLYLKSLNLGPSEAAFVPGAFAGVPGTPNGHPAGHGGRYNGPGNGDWDQFIISPAHYAVVIYAALVEAGRLSEDCFDSFNTDGSTMEMIGAEHSPGFVMTTGSFGQALSQAGGVALGRRLKNETGQVVVFLSDGEFEEGQTWEAIQCLAHHKLDNVKVIADVNGQQVDGLTKDVMNIEPLESKIRAFGGSVCVINGHDPVAIDEALGQSEAGKPHVVLCYTETDRGIPLLTPRKPHLHYVRFHDDAEVQAFREFHAAM